MGKIIRDRTHNFGNGIQTWRVSAALTPAMCWEVSGEGDTREAACEELEAALMGLMSECQEALKELEEYQQGEADEEGADS